MDENNAYAKWHGKKIHQAVHYAVFGFLSILVTGSILSAIKQSYPAYARASLKDESSTFINTKAAAVNNLRGLNNALLALHNQFQHVSASAQANIRSQAIAIISERAAVLESLIKANPTAAFGLMFDAQLTKNLSSTFPDAASFLEQQVVLSGVLITTHTDDFVHHAVANLYELEVNNKATTTRYKVHFASHVPDFLAVGTRLKISGIALGNNVVIADGSKDLALASGGSGGGLLLTTGDQHTLMIMINFQDNTSQPFTANYVSDFMFNSATSTNAYYKEVSFNQTSFSGDVVGWYTIPYSSTLCNQGVYANAALEAAQAAGVNLANYTRFGYVLPPQICNGMATSVYATFNNSSGALVSPWFLSDISTNFIHEFGHNLGLGHASAYSCANNSKSIDSPSNCISVEYGDNTDVMSSGDDYSKLCHFNAPHKVQLGFIPSSRVQTVIANGTYTIAPEEIAATGIQVLKIAKPDTNQFYYVGYRQPVGFDVQLTCHWLDSFYNGAAVYIDSGTTKLLDMVPSGTNSFYDAPLSDGQVFTDAINGITITQLSHSSSGVTVLISFGPGSCVPASPTISLSPSSQSGNPGQTLSYTASVTNNDSAVCKSTTFNLSSVVPSGWGSSFSPASVTLSPIGTSSSVLTAVSPVSSSIGQYNLSAAATDAASSSHTAASNIVTDTVFFNTSSNDNSAPSVIISSPADGALVTGTITIKATATDNVKVTKIDLYIDGVLQISTTKSSLSTHWNSSKAITGSHTITAKAYDAAGNMGTASVGVMK